jgi:ATP-dependent 26S proteasome regulatory subunit
MLLLSSFDLNNSIQPSLIELKAYLTENLNNIKSLFKEANSTTCSQMSFNEKSTGREVIAKLNDSFVNTGAYSREFFKNNRKQILSWLSTLLGVTVSATLSYFLFKWLMKNLDPTNADKLSAKSKAEKLIKEISIKNLELNEYELVMAANLVLPQNIDCSWNDIGGLEHIIDDLRETVIYPLKNFQTSQLKEVNIIPEMGKLISKRSRLIQPPKGVLLFGPPGKH